MSGHPIHTPYAQQAASFRIGLQQLGEESWIEPDDQLALYLNEKRRLFSEMPDRVFLAEPATEDVQDEVLELLVEHLLEVHSGIYSRENDIVIVGDTGHSVNIRDQSLPPLLSAAFLVQEDLVIMRKKASGWNLVSGSVSFPSSWSLQEKFSRPLHAIHDPVPGFEEGTRNAMMIERIFDNLLVDEPVERFNWSVYGDSELYHSDRSGEYVHRSLDSPGAQPHLRVERQTLQRLPKTGDILFTIRIHIDPLEMLANHPDCRRLMPAFVDGLLMLDQEQLAYKGLERDRDRLISMIRKLAPEAYGAENDR